MRGLSMIEPVIKIVFGKRVYKNECKYSTGG
jgi:hypothetical protein